jgi:hypothetical protein
MILISAGCFEPQVFLFTIPELQKGISYACYWPECYSNPDSDLSLAHLAETGAGWISLIVGHYQENIGSTEISATESTPTDASLIHAINQAHSLGLKVMLKPHLNLSRDPRHRRGAIGRAFVTESRWSQWFASYRAFIEHYAGLAAAHGVEQFCVGCELQGTTFRTADWRAVVAGVRSRYNGPLTYASTPGVEAAGIRWWDALDFIGIDAYYRTPSLEARPSLNELKDAWKPHLKFLVRLSTKWQKPILFTEIGYLSIEGTASLPADWRLKGKVDLKAQADCYQAVFESVYGKPWFAGMFWWVWGSNLLQGGPNDTGFSPHDKPAEEVLRTWFGGAGPRAPRPVPEPDPNQKTVVYSEGLSPGWEDGSWGAERDFASSDEPYRGRRCVRARLDPSGAVSIRHPGFDSNPYYFLEFYVRSSEETEPLLWAYFDGQDGRALPKVQVNDPRYIAGGRIRSGWWNRVSIPLADMGTDGARLTRFSLQDRSGKGTVVFWVDDIWLLGANWLGQPPQLKKQAAIR